MPSSHPSDLPSLDPSSEPSSVPSSNPTNLPSVVPSSVPSLEPSSMPSYGPTRPPSPSPTAHPTPFPSISHSFFPTSELSLCPSSNPSVIPFLAVLSLQVAGTCDCNSDVASGISDGIADSQISGADIISVQTTCVGKCVGGVTRGAGDVLDFSFELTLRIDESSQIPNLRETVISELSDATTDIVDHVAEDVGIELVAGPATAASDDDMSLSSSVSFDSSYRNFCIQVMNFKVNSVFKMRPCENETGNQRQKQLWSFDSTGKLRNKARPEWCMTWAGGKRKDLRLDLCDSATRKSSTFSYDESQRAIVVTNAKNKKRFLVGFDTTTKYNMLRLYGFNTENQSVKSFKQMLS